MSTPFFAKSVVRDAKVSREIKKKKKTAARNQVLAPRISSGNLNFEVIAVRDKAKTAFVEKSHLVTFRKRFV